MTDFLSFATAFRVTRTTTAAVARLATSNVCLWHQPAVSAYSSAFPLLEVNRRWCGEADPSQFDPIRKFWLFELRQVVKGDQFAEAELCYLAQAFRSLLRGQTLDVREGLNKGAGVDLGH